MSRCYAFLRISTVLSVFILLFFIVTRGIMAAPIVTQEGLEDGIGGTFSGFLATSDAAGYANTEQGAIAVYVGTIIQYIIATLGIIIFILIIYAGFRWMTAQGNSEQIDEAKAWLRNGVIGLVLVMMAYGIALFIVNRLGGAAGIISSGQ